MCTIAAGAPGAVGLASAAVLALSIQAGSLSSDDDPPVNQYGDATILDPDDTDAAQP